MIRIRSHLYAILTMSIYASMSHAQDLSRNSPQAGGRTYSENYKDMVLATCITTAYKASPAVVKDAGSSVSALRDWTHYDMDQATSAVPELVSDYLNRDYHNPVVESEVKCVRFDLLKCLDLYHSEALDEQVRRLVFDHDHTYRQNNPAPEQ